MHQKEGRGSEEARDGKDVCRKGISYPRGLVQDSVCRRNIFVLCLCVCACMCTDTFSYLIKLTAVVKKKKGGGL